jgi:hypothetical protein
MKKQDFEKRISMDVTTEEYAIIEKAYMVACIGQDRFIEAWLVGGGREMLIAKRKTQPKGKKVDFNGTMIYMGMADPDDRILVLAVAGYDKYEDVAEDLEITQHQAKFLWEYLQKRDALYGGKNYQALEAWEQEAGI